jgi:hypothetical protein
VRERRGVAVIVVFAIGAVASACGGSTVRSDSGAPSATTPSEDPVIEHCVTVQERGGTTEDCQDSTTEPITTTVSEEKARTMQLQEICMLRKQDEVLKAEDDRLVAERDRAAENPDSPDAARLELQRLQVARQRDDVRRVLQQAINSAPPQVSSDVGRSGACPSN